MSRRFIRAVATTAVAVAGAAGGAALVSAAGTGAVGEKNAAAVQYLSKPGCGPDKTNGVAGNSGRHTGQPPKAPNRQDCPSPPGQNK